MCGVASFPFLLLLQGTVYAVTTAHVLFDDETNWQYMNDRCNIKKVRKEIAKPPQSCRQIEIQLPNSCTDTKSSKITLPAKQVPLVAFRYKLLTSNWSNKKKHQWFLNDSVFFHIDGEEAAVLQHQLNHLNPPRQERLKTMTLEKLCNLYRNKESKREIMVKNFKGELIISHRPKADLENGNCLRLEFILQDDASIKEP